MEKINKFSIALQREALRRRNVFEEAVQDESSPYAMLAALLDDWMEADKRVSFLCEYLNGIDDITRQLNLMSRDDEEESADSIP